MISRDTPAPLRKGRYLVVPAAILLLALSSCGEGTQIGQVPPTASAKDLSTTTVVTESTLSSAELHPSWEGPPTAEVQHLALSVDEAILATHVLALGRLVSVSDLQWNTADGELGARDQWVEHHALPLQFERLLVEVETTYRGQVEAGATIEFMNTMLGPGWSSLEGYEGRQFLLGGELGPWDWLSEGEHDIREVLALYGQASYLFNADLDGAARILHVAPELLSTLSENIALVGVYPDGQLAGAAVEADVLLEHAARPVAEAGPQQLGYEATVPEPPRQPVVTDVP